MLHKYPWETGTQLLMLFFFFVLMTFLLSIFRTTVFLKLIMIPPLRLESYKSISIDFTCLDKNQFIKE